MFQFEADPSVSEPSDHTTSWTCPPDPGAENLCSQEPDLSPVGPPRRYQAVVSSSQI